MATNVRFLGLIVPSLNDTMQKEMQRDKIFFQVHWFQGTKKYSEQLRNMTENKKYM